MKLVIAIVLTACGIETSVSTLNDMKFVDCNSTYRLRY